MKTLKFFKNANNKTVFFINYFIDEFVVLNDFYF